MSTEAPVGNQQVATVAVKHRLRARLLEDGELAIALPGRSGAHAGAWGEKTWYLLIPCPQPVRRVAILQARDATGKFVPTLTNRSSDAEVLMLGSREQIIQALLNGPPWCRARRKREAGAADNLQAFRFPRTVGVPEAGLRSDGV